MEKKKKVIIAVLLLIAVVPIIIIFIVPYIIPLKITGKTVPYMYRLNGKYAEIVEYIGEEEEVIVPKKLMGHVVAKIATGFDDYGSHDDGFWENKAVKKITIPNTVTEIGRGAFMQCINLKDICLPENLKVIEGNMFSYCQSLTSIEIPEQVERIERHAFKGCLSLSDINISNNIKYIGSFAFGWCESLEEVTIPKSVQRIEGDAFSGTPWLESQKDKFVIAGAGNLIKYNGEDKVVNVPEDVRYIGSSLFFENDTIEKVNIPQSVTALGYEIFLECHNLKCVVLENDEIVLDDFLADCENVTIISREGSTGQKYAQENNIPWQELEE